jgi:threonine/homoserine/homoserine lactone efflux protein
MIYSLFKGILLGFTVAIILGPAVFSLLQTSIYRGFKAGVMLAFGIFFSDFILISLCYFGFMQIFDNPENQLSIGIIGGVILIVFGIVTFTRKPSLGDRVNQNEDVKFKKPKIIAYIGKGFLMNTLNPFLLIFWIGVVSFATTNYGLDHKSLIFFFSGTLGTILLTDIIKCYLAIKVRKFLNLHVITWLNRIVGITLAIFGIVLIVRVVIFCFY